ncbi:MAG: hypothetical protein RL432_1158 [Bacteroidota bacterium]|jgi:hypothetical protein
MKKLVLTFALLAFTGGMASRVYAAESGIKMEVRDDEKKKKKKKKGCCSSTEQKKCCSSGAQKSCSGDKH